MELEGQMQTSEHTATTQGCFSKPQSCLSRSKTTKVSHLSQCGAEKAWHEKIKGSSQHRAGFLTTRCRGVILIWTPCL